MKKGIKFEFFFFITIMVIFSCKKEKDKPYFPPSPGPINYPPKARAGDDIIVILPKDSAELTGTGTDSDGTIIAYRWERVSGPASFTIINPTTASAKLRNLTEGSYLFEFIVTDNGGGFAKDWLRLLVTPHNTNCICYPDPCDGLGDPCDPWDY